MRRSMQKRVFLCAAHDMRPPENRTVLTVPAETSALPALSERIAAMLAEAGCPHRAEMHVQLALEEAFVNVAHYAYEAGGDATVEAAVSDHRIEIRLIDGGKPYNPLLKADPNLDLAAADRPVGGLGVYLTKKLLDDVQYERKDEKNVLTLIKTW